MKEGALNLFFYDFPVIKYGNRFHEELESQSALILALMDCLSELQYTGTSQHVPNVTQFISVSALG